LSAAVRRSFDSLAVPNYRRYFAGQIVSLSGNWMQMVAEVWLILELTGSGVAVGATTALQFLPILLFGAWGGVLADRFPKRRLLIVTQALMALPALALLAVVASGAVAPWMVFALVFARGTVNAVDNPTRQAFAIEMVGPERLVNAVSLNSVLVHAARLVGPALAGLLIVTAGVEPCFALNALTFAAMIVALRRMEPAELETPPRAPREPGAVRAGLRYVRRTPELAVPLGLMALVGTLGLNFQVTLPLLARFSFDGGPGAYAALVSAMGVGSVIGALLTGAYGRADARLIAGAALAFGLLAGLAAAMPSLALEIPVLALLGGAAVTFAAAINSSLQLAVEPHMRGRVMALYSVVFLGSTPIGGPLAGWLAEAYDPRAALLLAASAGLAAAWAAHAALGRGPAAAAAQPMPSRPPRFSPAGRRRAAPRRSTAHRAQPRQHRGEAVAQPPGVGGARRLQLAHVDRLGVEPVGEVVDGADRRVGEAQLGGDDALGGDRHPDQVGVRGDQADLGRRLEAGADRLPVDAAVADLAAARPPGRNHLRAPGGVEAGRGVGALVGEDRKPQVQGDEVVGADQAADRQRGAQRAHRADRQHPVAALLEQGPHAGGVVDLVRQPVALVAVAPRDRGAVLGRRGDDLLAPGPERAAPQHHRQSPHRRRSYADVP